MALALFERRTAKALAETQEAGYQLLNDFGGPVNGAFRDSAKF